MKRILLSSLSVVLLALPTAVPGPARAADAPAAAKAPPADVSRLLERMVGTWSARDVAVQMRGESKKVASQVVCAKAAGGALECRVQVNLPGRNDEESDLFGWDPVDRRVHMFAVSPRYAHDHVGTVDGDMLTLDYDAARDGKPYHEEISFAFKGDREVLWKDTCTAGGQVVFAGEGTYRK